MTCLICQSEKDEDGSGSDLDEEPGGDQGQAAVLTVEAVVIGVEGEVVQIEEPETQKHQPTSIKRNHFIVSTIFSVTLNGELMELQLRPNELSALFKGFKD